MATTTDSVTKTKRKRWLILGTGLAVLALSAILTIQFWAQMPESNGKGTHNPSPFNLDKNEGIALSFDEHMNFGLVKIKANQVNPGNGRLTYDEDGRSNDLRFRIDSTPFTFGKTYGGKWVLKSKPLGPTELGGKKSVYQFTKGRIKVTQLVDVVKGGILGAGPDDYRQQYDTCRVRFIIENADAKSHTVGARFLLDTYINRNDGIPCIIPGNTAPVDVADLNGQLVPSFIQMIEKSNLKNPGITVQLILEDKHWESPDRVSVTRYRFAAPYDVPVEPINDDSSVAMFWADQELKPREKRTIGFTYGLGRLATDNGKLAIAIPNRNFVVGEEIDVVALASDPIADQTVRLNFLPNKCAIVEGAQTQRIAVSKKLPFPLPIGKDGNKVNRHGSQWVQLVSWRIRAMAEGAFRLTVESNNNHSVSLPIFVLKKTRR